jgi:quercetin dioxygenase-like cupin family protein
MDAVFIRLGEGEQLEVGPDGRFELLGSAGDSEIGAAVARVAPGMQTIPPHFHRHHAEAIFVLGGKLEMTLGEETVTAGAGCLALIPAGVVHAFQTAGGQPATFLEVYAPSGFEDFLRELAQRLPHDHPEPELMEEIGQRHDVIRA